MGFDEGLKTVNSEARAGTVAVSGMLTGLKPLLVTLYAGSALLYFVFGSIGVLGLATEMQSGFFLIFLTNCLDNVVNFGVMVVGICFSAAGILTSGRVAVLMGLHYGARILSWLGTTAFFWEKQISLPTEYWISAVISMGLPLILTLWYFISETTVSFFVLLLPGIITLSAYVMSVGGAMMQLGAGEYFFSGGITAVFRMIAELLVQALIICQGYLCGCMRRSVVDFGKS